MIDKFFASADMNPPFIAELSEAPVLYMVITDVSLPPIK